ncbi:MAG: hypothetical protein JW725_02215 [Candidatus Babeliaceae bacterium]|nr:hypothetical protein [Candidatus Babeliaceae bacterium]
MNVRITSNRIYIYIIILVVFLNCASSENLKGKTTNEFHPVEPNQIPEILTMISEKIRGNYERIETWQGEADIIFERIFEGERAERIFNTYVDNAGKTPKILKRHQEHKIKFAIDMEKDLLCVNSYRDKPSKYTDFETGKVLGTKSKPWYETSIVTPEYYLHLRPHAFQKDVVIRHMASKEANEKNSTCNRPPFFDPRENFLRGMPIWEIFRLLTQYIYKHGEWNVDGHTLKVEKCTDANNTKYRIIQPTIVSPGNYIFLAKTFSSEVGFNMILEENTNQEGRLLNKVILDYELVNGIYLPSKTTEQNYERENGGLSYEAKHTFKNQKVNMPIPEETFTYKNLGLKNGDIFEDKIEGKEYKYQDANLVFVKDLPAPASSKQGTAVAEPNQ